MTVLTDPDASADEQRRRLSVIVFTIFGLLVLYGVFRLIAPFATPIILGALVVVLTFRLYRKLTVRLRGRNYASALIMLLGITLLIILPTFLMIVLLVQQADALMQEMQDANIAQKISALDPASYLGWLKRIVPTFNPASIDVRGVIIGVIRGIPRFVTENGAKLLGGLVGLVVGFVLMLLASFYFYVDGQRLVENLVSLSPLPDRFDQEILKKFDDVINATFRGQILTALAQGAVTGIGLTIARVPGSLFWGAVAAVFSLLPMVGAAAVWVPATLYLFFSASRGEGGYGSAIFMALWGVLVISTVDNFVRPWAMKGRTELSAIVLLFSVLGGISAFGFVGLVLGPLLFALLMTVVNIYRYLFQGALESKMASNAEGISPEIPIEAGPSHDVARL